MNSNTFFRLAALGGALAALLPAFAQLPHTHIVEETDRDATTPTDVTVVIGDRESAAHAGEAFRDNAPVNPNDVGLPRFAIIGHENMFYLGIGLQFQGEAVFDWGDEMPSTINMIPNTLTPRTPGNGSNLRFSAETSSVYLSCVALPNNKNKVGLFFSANFTNNDYNFNLSHFYIKYRGLTAGYTNSAFTDGAVMPITIDNQGPNGVVNYTCVGGYWRQKFNKHWSGAIGLDAPSATMSYSSTTSQVSQRIPAFPVYLQYRWNKKNHLRASALMRPMQYRNMADAKNVTPFGWGVQLSGISNIAGGLSVVFAGSYGKGIGQYLNGDNGLGYDAVPVANTPGKLDLVKSMGLMGGLVYNISSKLASNVTYSHLSNWLEHGSVLPEADYRYGDYVAANLIYTVNRIVAVGLEYDYAKKKTWGGDTLHANRVQCQLAVTF